VVVVVLGQKFTTFFVLTAGWADLHICW